MHAGWSGSGALHVPPWPSVVEVCPPVAVEASLDVVAPGVVGEELEAGRPDDAVVPVHHLQVPEVGGAVEPLAGEVPAAHLRRRVRPPRPVVDHLAAELHHPRVVRQVGEQPGRPVAHHHARPELQPPVPVLGILRITYHHNHADCRPTKSS